MTCFPHSDFFLFFSLHIFAIFSWVIDQEESSVVLVPTKTTTTAVVVAANQFNILYDPLLFQLLFHSLMLSYLFRFYFLFFFPRFKEKKIYLFPLAIRHSGTTCKSLFLHLRSLSCESFYILLYFDSLRKEESTLQRRTDEEKIFSQKYLTSQNGILFAEEIKVMSL